MMRVKQIARNQDKKAILMSWLVVAVQFLILFIVAIAILFPAPFTPDQLPGVWQSSDLLISHWPTAFLIQQGRLPLWNPYYGGGQPLAADPLATIFYPPTQLVHFFSLRDYYLILMIGHLMFAGLGVLLLMRRVVGTTHFPALVAAVSYMATPRLISHLGAGHMTILQTVAWFPWLALGCWETVQSPRRWGGLFGICCALTLLAGHPQMAYYGLLMTLVFGIWLLVKRWRQHGRRACILSAIGLTAAGVLGILIAAIHLVPLMEFTAHSTRQLSVSSEDSYPLLNFLHALVYPWPMPQDPWEGMVMPGQIVLALALLASVTRWRKIWPLFCGIVLVVALAMGNASYLYLLVAHILPDFDRFRGLARIWFVGLLLIALLAGLGADILQQRVRRIWSRGTIITGLLIVLLVALSLIVLDTGYTRINDAYAATRPSLLDRAAIGLAGTGRIYGVQENISQASAVQMRVRLADGWNPLLIESYAAYMERAGGYTRTGYQLHIPYDTPEVQPNAKLLGMMDVSVVVSRRPLIDSHFMFIEQVDNTLLYKNMQDAGPGYLVGAEPNGALPAIAQVQPNSANVRTLQLSAEQDAFSFSTRKAAYFVIATPDFPGWTAELDGQSAPVQQLAGVLPAIKVSPGEHRLSYTYRPRSVLLGALLSAIGLLAALMWMFIGRYATSSTPHL